MLLRVLVNGANGRMGKECVKTLPQEQGLSLVAQTDKADDLIKAIKNSDAQVVIDFTAPDVVYDNIIKILKTNARPVIGTTGLSAEQIQSIEQRCRELKRGAIIAPNFSIGAVLMMRYAQAAAQYFSQVEIIELHHAGKLDSPSGTAIKTADMIAEAISLAPVANKTKETIPGALGAKHKNIPIHAIRLPGLVAHQEVIFGGIGETLKIRHDSINRECFMPGVILACRKVMELEHLVYGLDKLI